MKPRRNIQYFASVAVSLLLACTRASTPLPKPVGKPIGISTPHAAVPEGFAVVFAGPEGEVAVESEIQVLFSRPLRAMTPLAEAPIPTVHMRPPLEGTWRWLGTQALVFSPARKRLPFATAIEIEVPAETRALDGTVLGHSHVSRLHTPVPKLVSVSSSDDSNHLRADSQFELRFDQPIDVAQLRSKISLDVTSEGRTTAFPFTLAVIPTAHQNQNFRLTPNRAMPKSASVRVTVGIGLVGVEGPLPTNEPQWREFETISPLRVARIECDRSGPRGQCDSRSGIDLEFNNPVSLRGLKGLLTIDGKRAKLANWHDDTEVTSFVHLPGPFRAGTTASLRVGPGLRDDFGQTLAQAHVEAVTFDEFYPKMEVGLAGEIFETVQPTAIPIGAVNVSSYERLYLPLEIEGLAALLSAKNSDDLFALGRGRPGANVDERTLSGPRNQLVVESFEPATKAGRHLGASLVGVRYDGVVREGTPITLTDARLIQRTNIGISGEVGRHASVVWATELDSGRAIANAEVLVLDANGKVRKRVNANPQGIAELGADAFAAEAIAEPWTHPAAIVVRNGADYAFRRVADLLPEWRVPVPVDRSGQLGTKLMLFTERGLYRPGERVDVKAILRDEQPRGLGLPTARPVRLQLVSPDAQVVATTTVKTSEFGTCDGHFAVPLSAKTGLWSVRASSDQVVLGTTELTVGEYRPVELEVNVAPARNEMLRGGRTAFSVSARTLFGMVAGGAKARLEAYRERTTFVPPGAEAYVTDSLEFDSTQRDVSSDRAQLLLSEVTLDGQGKTEATVSADLPAARGPEWIHFEAEVTDSGQNPVAATGRTLVHPADHYVGLKRSGESWIAAPTKLAIDVAVFGLDGSRRSGRVVDVEFLRRQWSVVRREVNGVIQTKSEPHDEVVGRCQVQSAAEDRRCNFDVARSGSYFAVARSKDDQQRLATAARAIFAAGPGAPDFTDEDDRRIELVPDKTSYRVGDVAKILVKSAVTDSDALVVVGRSDVQSAELRRLTGTTPILEVPIRADMRPNLYVSVHLVTGRKRPPPSRLDQPDLGAPTYRLGWAELKIDSTDRRLAVDLAPSTRSARPGSNVDVTVALRDGDKRPVRGEVTLWAVDEGVLALGNYEVPDPLRIFLGSRPLQLLPLESRESLGRRTLAAIRNELGLSKGSPGSGGGESGGSNAIRQDFRATAFFLPNLVTDGDGRVKATMRMPDGLTSYRLFAVAVTGAEQYGFASDRIVTSKPLMVRPTMPRFFRAGDRAEVAVTLSALDVPDGEAKVAFSGTGLVPKQQQQTTYLRRGASVELLFPVEATEDEVSSAVFDATGSGQRDIVKLSRPIRRALPVEVVAESGMTHERALQKIGDLSGVRKNQTHLELHLSNSFLGGTVGGFRGLVEYPYGCSEQIASRLMALLPLAELARSAGVELPKNRDQLIDIAIAELLKRQRHDGGFGMWPEAERSEPWVSAHVLAALEEAKRGRGALTKDLERGAEYLQRIAVGMLESGADATSLATLPYLADVSFRMGKGDPATLTRLYELRQQMPVFAQALLLHAYARSRHDAKAIDVITGELERWLHQDGAVARVVTNTGDDYARLFDSETRTAAVVTWALAEAKPEHPLLVPLAKGLLEQRRNGTWSNTQESAFALLALDNVRRQTRLSSSAIAARVSLGDKVVFAGAIGGKSPPRVTQRVSFAELEGNANLLFETEDGPLLYEAKLHYVPQQAPKLPIDAGFAIERRFIPVRLDGTLDTLPPASLESCVIAANRGQSFVVELSVVVPRPRDYVVIDAPLPAGFEAIDVSHRTSSGWMRKLDDVEGIGPLGRGAVDFHRDLRDDRAVFLVDHFPVGLYRFRFLARAVTRGHFSLPPARVEGMYAPERFGTTTACAVDVK